MFDAIFRDVKGFFVATTLRKKYSPLDATISEEYNAYRTLKNKKLICHAPFTNIYFGRQGNVVSCCHNRKHIIGNYPQQSIEEIWNGEKLRELRSYIKHKDLNSGCHVCKWDLEQRNFGEVKALHFDSLPYRKFPSMMEFELDNTCNLECSMCNGEFSSSIRKNREHKPPILSVYDNEFVTQLKPFIPHLKETRFSGGEPFLIDIYSNIWAEIIDKNPKCLISVQTNGTVMNARLKELLESGKFEIGISLDSLDKDVYESIRDKADFETVMQNLEYFGDYCQRKGTNFRISVCAMRENWREIPAYLNFCRNYNAYLQIHTVWFPPESSLWNLDKASLDEIHQHLSSVNFEAYNLVQNQNYNHYKNFCFLVKQWFLKANFKKEVSADIYENLKELKAHLLNKVVTYIMSDEAISNAEKERRKGEIVGKMEKVLARFNKEKNMIECIKKMIEVPVEITVSVIHIESEDRIYEYMKAYVRE